MHAASRVRPFRATLERVAVFIVLAALWEWAVDIFAIKPYPIYCRTIRGIITDGNHRIKIVGMVRPKLIGGQDNVGRRSAAVQRCCQRMCIRSASNGLRLELEDVALLRAVS